MTAETKIYVPLHYLVLERLDRSLNDFRSCGHEYHTMGRFRHIIVGEVDQWLEMLHHADFNSKTRREVDKKIRELCRKASWSPELKAVFNTWGFTD